MSHRQFNSIEWTQALGLARHSCARGFRDGLSPADIMRAFGLVEEEQAADWSHAVQAIAAVICAAPSRRAA